MCTHPLHAFPTGRKTDKGKDEYFISTNCDLVIPVSALHKMGIFVSTPLTEWIEVPCGKCYECKKDKARKWAFRCLFEAMSHKENYFLTLTYDDLHLACNNGLKDLQDFIKRVRKSQEFRYFACMEYGELNGRLHFHLLAFGLHLSDLVPFSGGSNPLFRSDFLESKWENGFVSVGIAKPSACGNYIAKYTLKSVDKKGKLVMSRKPGIGLDQMLHEVMKDNPNPAGWKLLTIGDGRGNLYKGSLPRSLRERLGLSADEEIVRACILKTQNKMRACGYSVQDTFSLDCVEKFRETQEEIDKLKEVHSNLLFKQ